MRKNPVAKLYQDKVKTGPPVEETISQSKSLVQNTDVRLRHQEEISVATSTAEQLKTESSDRKINEK